MIEPEMRKSLGDNVEIQLAVWNGEGRTVLCVHGLTANCRCWDHMALKLSPEHRTIAMDLRGRGLSEKPDKGYSVFQHCKDISKIITDIGEKRVVLMGHSLGASIVIAFAALYPEQTEKIIVIDGGGKLSDEHMAKIFLGIKPSLNRLGQVFPSYDRYVALLKKLQFFQPWSGTLDAYFRYDIQEVESGVCSRIQKEHVVEEIENLTKFNIEKYYAKVLCPVLILKAGQGIITDDDRLLPEYAVKKILDYIPHAKIEDLSGKDHYSIIFQPDVKRDRSILKFLEEQV